MVAGAGSGRKRQLNRHDTERWQKKGGRNAVALLTTASQARQRSTAPPYVDAGAASFSRSWQRQKRSDLGLVNREPRPTINSRTIVDPLPCSPFSKKRCSSS